MNRGDSIQCKFTGCDMDLSNYSCFSSILIRKLLMLRITRILLLFIFISTLLSCEQKAFPDERLVFTPMYRNLINPYHTGDTLFFTNETGEVTRISITGTDSITSNSKGSFINERPYKYININCEYLDYKNPKTRDSSLVYINKFPDNQEQSCHFSFMNFRGDLTDDMDSLVRKIQPGSGKSLTNCFVIKK